MKTLILDVTAQDLEFGTPGHCERCPVARALTRMLGEGCVASVSIFRVDIYGKNFVNEPCKRIFSFKTPDNMAQFMHDFDSNKVELEPVTFTIELEEAT